MRIYLLAEIAFGGLFLCAESNTLLVNQELYRICPLDSSYVFLPEGESMVE